MRGFVNPYNFIRFPKEKAKAYEDTDIHTGVIEYTVTTKTPLFIPNSSSDHAFKESEVKDHKSYDFFSYTELETDRTYDNEYHVPVIPGSEIRGVVRQVYETLTDSCMGILNVDAYPVKRTMGQFKPALIHRTINGKLELLNADSYRIEMACGEKEDGSERYSNGTIVYFNRIRPGGLIKYYSFSKDGDFNGSGCLIKWEMGCRKKRYHIFAGKNAQSPEERSLSKDVIERKLLPVIESYLSQPNVSSLNEKAYQEYKQDLQLFLKEKGEGYFPVCYSKLGNEILYLAPAVFSKEISDHNIETLAGSFSPCKEEVCPACDLFGYVRKNNENCKGSKVRFSDMYVREKLDVKEYYLNSRITLQNLGEPKLGNVDFYLKRPAGAQFWTYDYYYADQKLSVYPGELRGRKFYWHHQKVNLPKNIVPVNLNKTVRMVKEGIEFSGKLYFESISQKQLDQLIWILNSGTEGLGLKLGGAKPLGMGSIMCSVDRVTERRITVDDGKIKYILDEADQFDDITYESVGFSNTVKKEFYKIAGLKTVPADVEITYPKENEQKGKLLDEGYKWFTNNLTFVTGGMVRNRESMKISEALPQILDQDFSLPYNDKPVKKNSYKNNGRNGKYGTRPAGRIG